ARALDQINQRGVEAQRIRIALDGSSTLMMLADNDRNIVYINAGLRKMLREAASEIRKDLPHFDPENLLGANIDVFHKKPAHQTQMIAALKDTHFTDLKLGDAEMKLAVSPVSNADGVRIGTVVEWSDVTAERRVLRELDAAVSMAAAGEFDKRVELDGAPAHLAAVLSGFNTLLDGVVAGVEANRVAISNIADGDLTARMEGDFNGAFEELQSNINRMAERIQTMVAEIKSSAAEVNRASASISTGSNELSSRAESQASSLQETAATMEEMTATIRANAENSTKAAAESKQTADQAQTGGRIVRDTIEAMDRIQDSATRITDIVNVIDGIAFQTNLLALNAAVEAARAGESGKGFAVVASEVRALAQRSAEAAKDISALIQESSSHVGDGVRLVGETGESLEAIASGIDRMDAMIKDITAASREQASGVEEISNAINHMDEMTQHNAAMANESASQAKGLQSQADALSRQVAAFRIGEGGGQPLPGDGSREATADADWSATADAMSSGGAAPLPNGAAPTGPKAASGDWAEF
ncbi:MAG: methyl-accepting chemotaxis protein, partial [Pseudomonadota bacterium]